MTSAHMGGAWEARQLPRVAGAWERGELFFPVKKERGSGDNGAEKGQADPGQGLNRAHDTHTHTHLTSLFQVWCKRYSYSKYLDAYVQV